MADSAQHLEDWLLADFDESTVRKGRACFDSGAVQELNVDGQTLTALVRGARSSPYCVHMHVDEESNLPDAMDGDCTCRTETMCEHMAAALFAVLEQVCSPPPAPALPVASGRDRALEQISRLLERKIERRETTVPLDSPEAAPHSLWASNYLDPRPDPVPREDRWRLVFAVGVDEVQDPSPDSAGPITRHRSVLLPAVQYITRTGELGRVEKHRPERVTEPPGGDESHLLSRILANGGRAPLVAHWDYLLEHPGIPLFASDGEGRPLSRMRYTIRRIREVAIRMEPAVQSVAGSAQISLRPLVRFSLVGEETSNAAKVGWLETWETKLLVSLDHRVLAWMDADARYVGLVGAMVLGQPFLNPADVQALQARFESDRPAGITLDIPYRAVRLVTDNPATRLVVGRGQWSTDIGVSVHFDYGEDGVGEDAVYVLHVRDRPAERGMVQALRELFRDGVQASLVAPHEESGATALLRLGTDVEEFLRLYGDELLARGFDLYVDGPLTRVERLRGSIRISVESGVDWFGLKANADVELDLRSVGSEDRLFAAGFIRSRGRLLYIGKDEAEKLKRVLALLDPDSSEPRVSARDMDAVSQLGEIVESHPPDLDRLVAVARTLSRASELPELPVPAGLTATLRSYQRTGYSWLAYLADNGMNGCLADDMGLGKTVQTLAFLVRRKEAGEASPSLVVAPVSTIENWRREAARFTPGLRVLVHHGPSRCREPSALAGVDLVVVSYATLRIDAKMLHSMLFDVVVLDEAQSIKNPLSQSFTVVKGLRSRCRVSLTGTPLENSVVDLWSQLDFLEPGLLGSLGRFRADYGQSGDGTRVERLKRIIRPFILRRTKEVVESSLPPKEETVLYAEMGARQAAAYQAIRKRYRVLVAGALKANGVSASGALIFEGLLRLRQAACFPAHADAAYEGVPSCKMEVFGDLLEEVRAGGHRLLVFSQFVQSLAEIKRVLEAQGTAYCYLDGSTPNRQDVIDTFQLDGGPPVFLLSLKAGGVGINLTAADYVVILDPWWNPAVESQAVDRSHRIGQSRAVFVYRIVTRETIEEQVLELQQRKRSLARDLVDQDPKSLLSLTEAEILGLFDDTSEEHAAPRSPSSGSAKGGPSRPSEKRARRSPGQRKP